MYTYKKYVTWWIEGDREKNIFLRRILGGFFEYNQVIKSCICFSKLNIYGISQI